MCTSDECAMGNFRYIFLAADSTLDQILICIFCRVWNLMMFCLCYLQKSVKSTTWSNSPVDISLDNLSPMSHKDKPVQPSMNELYSNQQQVPSATMGFYNMPQQGMYPMGMPPMNTNYPVMGMAAPQINTMGPNMSQMAVSSNVPMMPMTNRAMGMMQPRPMGQMQNFGTSGYSTYKGISWCLWHWTKCFTA